MDILVIGNGFDIEHGLPTQYKDFLDFMKGIKEISGRGYINSRVNFASKLDKIIGHKPNERVSEFLCDEKFFDHERLAEWENESSGKELIDCSRNNIWLKYFLENENYIDKRWVDFEAEISKVIKGIEYAKEMSIFYKNNVGKYSSSGSTLLSFEKYDGDKNDIIIKIIEYGQLKTKDGKEYKIYEILGDEFKNIVKRLNKDLVNLIRCLEIYLCEYVEKIDITKNKSKYIEDNKYDGVLSFNYTNTFEKIYKTKMNADVKTRCDYIHGKADLEKHTIKEKNNMVLGIDEYLSEEDKNDKLDFIQFKKYFQRIFKKTGNEYIKWLELIREDIIGTHNSITIFGHSLDVSDKDILRQLMIKNEYYGRDKPYGQITQVIIYYHDEETYAQQISNLVKIIGQDELIDRVYGENPRITFIKQD